MAQQTDLAEAGETYGKSCDVIDATNKKASFCFHDCLSSFYFMSIL